MEIKINIRKRVFPPQAADRSKIRQRPTLYECVATPADLYGEELYQAMAAKLHEVLAISDRVAILRKGEYIVLLRQQRQTRRS